MSPRDATPTPPADGFPRMSPAELRAAFFQVFPAVALSIMLAAADQTITATALPAIGAEFGAVDRVSWVVVAYLVAATVAAPVFGRLADAYGRSRLMLVALVVNIAGNVLAGMAGSFEMLVASRLVQGCAGGGLTTLSMALIGEALPPRERGRFQAYIATCFVIASSLGPVAGGWLTQHQGWRAIFWATLPLFGLALLLALRLPRRKPAGAGAGFTFDLPGLVLFACFVAPTLLALSRLQRLSWETLPLAGGLLLLAALALWLLVRQERRAPHPLLPLKLLAEPTIWRADLMTGFVHGANVALISFLPIYLQSVRGLSPSAAGFFLLPLSFGGFMGGLLAGQVMTRTGLTMALPTLTLPAAALLLAGIGVFADRLGDVTIALAFGLASLCYTVSYPVSQISVQIAAGPARLGAAAASVQFARSLGAALATALLSAVLFGTLAAGDPQVAALFGRLVREGPALLATLDQATRDAVRAGLTGAFTTAFLGVALLVAAAGWLAWRAPMRRV